MGKLIIVDRQKNKEIVIEKDYARELIEKYKKICDETDKKVQEERKRLLKSKNFIAK